MARILLYSWLILSCSNPKVKPVENTVAPDSLRSVKPIARGTLARDFMLSADSVVIVSHLYSYNTQTDVTTSLFKNEVKLNDSAIQERKVLSKSNIIALATILDSVNDGENSSLNCFEPHHAILAYKGRKISDIDICFDCKGFSAFEFPFERHMNDTKYDKLKAFFKNMGFSYEL